MIKELKSQYGYLFDDQLLQEICKVGIVKEIPEGFMLLDIGQPIEYMPLLISGALKIMREDTKGDELILYYVEQGDTCAVSLSCCMQKAKSNIRAVAETDTRIVLIPISKMMEWLSKHLSWQRFVINSYSERLNELFDVVDTLAFMKMDSRLLKYLKDKAMINHDEIIQVTHNEIAKDLNSSRVVISRVLKQLEKSGYIELQRNAIKLITL